MDAGAQRLLATLGDKRTRWNAPTVKELGVDTVSNSPYGLVGPKGMPPQVVKVLHDAFKKALDDPGAPEGAGSSSTSLLVQVERGLRPAGRRRR